MHERTITVEMDGKSYNIKTRYDGKTVSDKEAVKRAIKNKSRGKGYNTSKEALDAAKKRSAGGKKH